jgi:DNA repair exonuclease SbcCD ATPase subunit
MSEWSKVQLLPRSTHMVARQDMQNDEWVLRAEAEQRITKLTELTDEAYSLLLARNNVLAEKIAELKQERTERADDNTSLLAKNIRLKQQNKQLQSRLDAVVPMLEKARDAIASLPIDSLGVVAETHDCPAYPIRDELLHRISAALKQEKKDE